MNVQGGYFLKEDIALFDASFFNFTSEVASVRMLLFDRFLHSRLIVAWFFL